MTGWLTLLRQAYEWVASAPQRWQIRSLRAELRRHQPYLADDDWHLSPSPLRSPLWPPPDLVCGICAAEWPCAAWLRAADELTNLDARRT